MTIHSSIPARSARDDYSEVRGRLAAHDAVARDLAAGADVAGAEREVAAAEEAFCNLDRDAAVAGRTVTPEVRVEAGERLRRAVQRAKDARAAHNAYLDHVAQRPALLNAVTAARVAVVQEEGVRLAEKRRRLLRAAERAEIGVEALIHWALYQGDVPGVAVALREALKAIPSPANGSDPGAFDRARREREADLVAFRQAYANLPERLESDPDAVGPDPEAKV